MGHFGLTELLIIMVVILLLFGAKRIPEVAGSMGKGIKEFKKGMNELEHGSNPNSAAYPPPRLTAEELQRPAAPGAAGAPVQEPERREPRRLL
jgi:sec-independent protein translocase protein TatA